MPDNIAVPSSKMDIVAECLPTELDDFTEEMRARARTELHEDAATRAQCLSSLKSLLQEEKGLRWLNDDLFLLSFLRARKFDVKKAHALVKGLYNSFGKHGHIYYDFSFDRLRTVMEESSVNMLPNTDGSVLVCFRFSSWNPGSVSAEEHLVSMTLGLIQALRCSPSTQIAGFHFIMDFEGFSLRHLLCGTPYILAFISDLFQNSVPIRVRGMHVVKETAAFYYLWSLLKRFLSKKLAERMHAHGSDVKNLHALFHPSVLPAEWGGELPPYDNTDWRRRMEASETYLRDVLSFGYEKHLNKWTKKNKS